MPSNKKARKSRNFRLPLIDDDTHGTIWELKFSRINVIVAAITTVTVLFALFFCLIAFTPLRSLIPGYPDAASKREAIRNTIRLDSLQKALEEWELYSEDFRKAIEGQPADTAARKAEGKR